MTYLQFHLVFIAPVLLLLAPQAVRARARFGARALWTLPLLMLLALLYTTPWDNYLVYRGIWYYGADRVLGTIGYVPVEEYAFFLLQPLLTTLWLYRLLLRAPSAAPQGDRGGWGYAAVALLYAAAAVSGAAMLLAERTLYLGLILAWAAPVLLGQWLLMGRSALARARLMVWAIAVPTLYLWVADRIAIGTGIWTIAPEYTVGLHLFGLPLEEAAFFLVTNVLVVQGALLFLLPHELRVPWRARGQRAVPA